MQTFAHVPSVARLHEISEMQGFCSISRRNELLILILFIVYIEFIVHVFMLNVCTEIPNISSPEKSAVTPISRIAVK